MWTYLNFPNSGLPADAQPSGAVASLTIWSKEICFFGHPSTFAIGSQVAITSGVRTIDGFSSAT